MNPIGMHSHEDKLLEFAYGELPAVEARALEAHVKGCQRCAGALENIRGVRNVMAQLTPEPVPDAGLDSLLAYAQQAARRTQAGPEPAKVWWRRWLVPMTGVAALAVVAVVAGQAVLDFKVEEQVAQAKAEEQVAKVKEAEAPVARGSDFPKMAEKDAVQAPPSLAVPGAPSPVADTTVAEAQQQAPMAQKATTGTPVGPKGGTGVALPVEVEYQRKSAKKKKADWSNSGSMGGKLARMDDLAEPAPASADVAAAGAAPADEEREEFLKTAQAVRQRKAEAPAASAAPAAVPPKPEPTKASSGGLIGGVSLRGSSAGVGSRSEAATTYGEQNAVPATAPERRPAPSEPQDARTFLAKADAAKRAGDRTTEMEFLRAAVTSGPDPALLERLLTRLCNAELELGADTIGCERLMREFPDSSGARVAQRRLRSSPESKPAAPAEAMPAQPAKTAPSKR